MTDFELFLEEEGLTQEALSEIEKTLPAPMRRQSNETYEVRDSTIQGKGVFLTEDGQVLDAVGVLCFGQVWTELGRYTNHSGTPNTKPVSIDGVIHLIIAEDTPAGTELTVDYRAVRDALKSFRQRIVAVDDFCEYPHDVAASAKAGGFGTWKPEEAEVGSGKYEGMGYTGLHALLIKPLTMILRSVLIPNSMFFRSTNVGMEKAYIHSDRTMGDYTAIVYLSSHDEPSGTAFYRHIPTGLTEMPSVEDMKILGIYEQLKDDMVSRDPSKWELLYYVEGKFNRALVFDAPLFHSRYPLEGIGSTAESGRLIWASHFYKMNGYGEFY